ncbi:hypothetical protein F5Y00DRAFT_269091 [Daldinia vernicosa]|uniref:uncharacterized protein n=1 Tax=Daldinia vernicosa TaxID=114800 RepID=UPI002007A5AA|nr:uncharacterized protein F5Y00DRAFT_269091 [Daldinia vernicosa]KAI0853665.1 hypothetical protein F5Y00DRAFT_269091 [Daldinia vernicosa]
MTPLTRKRKAELEAAAQQAPVQTQPETKQSVEEPSLKRQKLTDPFKRTDPFRPHSPPPKTVIRRRSLATKLKQPLPVVFFTIPATNPSNQVSAKGRSSNDLNTIMLTKSLFEHADKYGAASLPTKETLDVWLEGHKDIFIQARKEGYHQQVTSAQPPQDSPRAATHPGVLPETTAPQHNLAADQNASPRRAVPTNRIIIYRAICTARHTAAHILTQVAAILEGPAVEPSITHEGGQQNQQQPTPAEAITAHKEEKKREEDNVQEKELTAVGTKTEPTRVRPVAPPLDTRFFHPNGQLQSVYRYLTAQIPLPRQWVRWAINNGINKVPGRGDIREPGVYVAEDTFDYDALFEAVHRGCFRTGRLEIDGFSEYWPMVRGRRDSTTVDLALHHLPTHLSSLERTELDEQVRKSNTPTPEPSSVLETGTVPTLHAG